VLTKLVWENMKTLRQIVTTGASIHERARSLKTLTFATPKSKGAYATIPYAGSNKQAGRHLQVAYALSQRCGLRFKKPPHRPSPGAQQGRLYRRCPVAESRT
jgi:hypothetical protein